MGIEWRACLIQASRDFCENTSLHGFQYLVEKRPKLEKLSWFVVLSTSILVAVYLFYMMSIEFAKTPTVISLESSSHPIGQIEFPGIAICDVNKISKKALEKLASEKFHTYRMTLGNLTEKLRYLGALYDFSTKDIIKIVELDRLMESKKDPLAKNSTLIKKVMKDLTTPCDKMLVQCSWMGSSIDCNKYFDLRRTMIGYCCTFNGQRKRAELVNIRSFRDKKVNTSYLNTAGYEMGLTVLLRVDAEDYTYPLLETTGVRVFTFSPYDYPDMYSGGLIESLIPIGWEVFLKIEASKVYAVDALKSYTVQERWCILDSDDDEYSKQGSIFDSSKYSYSNCIAECKMKSILALCDCIPFFMPVSENSEYSNQVCTLSDTTCLDKYSDKWMTIFPTFDPYNPDLAFERDNSIKCDKCYPACTYTNYDISNDYSTLIDTADERFKGFDRRTHSLIHIYYDTENAVLYKTDLYFYWFDQLSNFGGLCGLFLGFSIISLIEFIYFFTVRYVQLLKKSWVENKKKLKEKDDQKPGDEKS